MMMIKEFKSSNMHSETMLGGRQRDEDIGKQRSTDCLHASSSNASHSSTYRRRCLNRSSLAFSKRSTDVPACKKRLHYRGS